MPRNLFIVQMPNCALLNTSIQSNLIKVELVKYNIADEDVSFQSIG